MPGKMKWASTILLLWVVLGAVQGQTITQRITGRITDAVNGQVLPGATVVVLGNEPPIGGVTGPDGRFEIKAVPVGRHDLKVTFVGYTPYIVRGILLLSAKPFLLDVALQPSLERLEEITVVAPNDKKPLNNVAKVSARSFSLEESQRYAGGLSDPARAAYSFAGVAFGAPQDNGVVVRGNSPTNVLWRIEGIEVPGAAHFGGGNLAGAGLITIYSANVLGTSDFISGAFPAEYGNVTSGVFDINFRRGYTEQTKYTMQLGVLGADLAVEGPLNADKNTSFLANYRHGFIGYYGRAAGGVAPDYQDFSFVLHDATNRFGDFSLWGIGGLSAIFTPFGEYEVDEEDGEIDRRETEGDFQQDDIDFDMGAVGLSHQISIGQSARLHSALAVTTQGYRSLSDWFTPDADTLNTGRLSPYSDLKNRETKLTATTGLTYRFSEKYSQEVGFIADWIGFKSQAKQADRPRMPLRQFLDVDSDTYNWQAYIQSILQLSPSLSLQGGVNINQFGLSKETTLEPRAGMRWQALAQLSFGMGYGLHSRRQEPRVYFFEYIDESGITQNHKSLKRMKAHHFVASAEWRITPSLRLNIEAYYQDLYDVPVVPDSSYSLINYTQQWELDAPLTNEGTGFNKGIDISFEQSFNKNFYFLLSGSVFDSKYIGGDGIERNTLFNRGWLTTLTAGREFKVKHRKKNRKNFLGFNFRTTYMGGQRLTPFLLAESQAAQQAVLDYSNLYGLQSEEELWLDVGITYKINKPKLTATWGLDFKNTTLVEQLQGFEYNFFTNRVEEKRVLFILPNLYYKIEF